MKLLTAIIKPDRLEAVKEALASLDISGMTVSEVRGYGRQKGHTEIYRGAEYDISFVPKIRIDVAIKAILVDRAVQAITDAARSGRIGDGKIFVTPLEAAVRIRTGETGEDTL